MYILAASLPSYKILIVGGLLPWARKFISARDRNRKAYGSGTTNDVYSNMGPFSKLRNDSADPGVSSAGAGYRASEAFPRRMDDGHEIHIPLNTLQVNHEVDVNATKGRRCGDQAVQSNWQGAG